MNNLELAERLDRLQPMQVIDDYGREVVGLSVGTLVTPSGNEPAIRISSRTEVAEMEFIPRTCYATNKRDAHHIGLFLSLAIPVLVLAVSLAVAFAIRWLALR